MTWADLGRAWMRLADMGLYIHTYIYIYICIWFKLAICMCIEASDTAIRVTKPTPFILYIRTALLSARLLIVLICLSLGSFWETPVKRMSMSKA